MFVGGFPSPALHGSDCELARINEHSIKYVLVGQRDDEPQEAGVSPNRQTHSYRKEKR